MFKKIVLFALSVFICLINPTLRIQEIENRTPDGLYTIQLNRGKMYIPPLTKVIVDDLLGTSLRYYIEIACIKGEYDPIFINFEQDIFKCDGNLNAYIISMWIGAQTCLPSKKTFIPFCASTDAALKLLINEDGIPELFVRHGGNFL